MIFSKISRFFDSKLRESAGNRSQMVSGCVRDVLTRSRASQRSPSFENIEKTPKIRGWQPNPLLRLSSLKSATSSGFPALCTLKRDTFFRARNFFSAEKEVGKNIISVIFTLVASEKMSNRSQIDLLGASNHSFKVRMMGEKWERPPRPEKVPNIKRYL